MRIRYRSYVKTAFEEVDAGFGSHINSNWYGRDVIFAEPDATDTDEYWLANGYITAVPVACDMTAKSDIEFLSKRLDR